MRFGFSQKDAQRIAAAVRKSEQEPRPANSRPTPYNPPFMRWLILGRLESQLISGGTANMNVMYFDGSNHVDSGEDIQVFDYLLKPGLTIAAGKKVAAMLDAASGRYVVVQAECE